MSDPIKRTLPTRLPTALDHELQQKKHEVFDHRPGEVDAVSGAQAARAGANFDEKIYWMPESYNALRRELHENWPTLFARVGYAMAFDAPMFIEMMDAALDTKTGFDSDRVDATCKKYLDLLRIKRGVSPLHPTAAWNQGPKLITGESDV